MAGAPHPGLGRVGGPLHRRHAGAARPGDDPVPPRLGRVRSRVRPGHLAPLAAGARPGRLHRRKRRRAGTQLGRGQRRVAGDQRDPADVRPRPAHGVARAPATGGAEPGDGARRAGHPGRPRPRAPDAPDVARAADAADDRPRLRRAVAGAGDRAGGPAGPCGHRRRARPPVARERPADPDDPAAGRHRRRGRRPRPRPVAGDGALAHRGRAQLGAEDAARPLHRLGRAAPHVPRHPDRECAALHRARRHDPADRCAPRGRARRRGARLRYGAHRQPDHGDQRGRATAAG